MCQHGDCREDAYENGLCIFHCPKDINNDWIDKSYATFDDVTSENENKKIKWNKRKVKTFWSEFTRHLGDIQEKEINITGFVFPIYWITQYQHQNIFKALSKKKILFDQCEFLDYFYLEMNDELINWAPLVFRSCKFQDRVQISAKEFQQYVAILYCELHGDITIRGHFKDDFEIANIESDKRLFFNGCVFDEEAKISSVKQDKFCVTIEGGEYHNLVIRNNHIDSLYIAESKFHKLKIFEQEVKKLTFENNDFEEDSRILFENIVTDFFYMTQLTQDSKFIRMDHITVKEELLLSKNEFKNTYFNDFNIEDCKIAKIEKTSFIDAHLNSFKWGNISRLDASKDMFRQLKFVNDKQGNIIEANNFYVMEMKKHNDELKEKFAHKPWIFWQDKLIFWINENISDFSRSWFLPLVWFVMIGVLFVFGIQVYDHGLKSIYFKNIFYPSLVVGIISSIIGLLLSELFHKRKRLVIVYSFEIFTVIMFLYYGYLSGFNPFNEFADFMNPKIQDQYKPYSFFWFLHKALIGFIIYHFVVALRRQTTR